MKNLLRYVVLVLAALPVAIFFQNCGQPGSISSALESGSITPTDDGDPPILPPEVEGDTFVLKSLPSNKFICEPFGNGGAVEVKGGLKAEISYIKPDAVLSNDPNVSEGQARNSYRAVDYFTNAVGLVKPATPLFLSQVNVPTRNFDQGFKLSDNTFLSYANGNKMVEYFSLKMQSLLKLSSTDQEGYYALATISDDGSRLYLGEGANQKLFVNNDEEVHSMRMKCATEAVYMTANTKIPLLYYYSQGPATEIGSVVAWKYLGQNPVIEKHKNCDVTDKVKFWNHADSSEGEFWREAREDGFKIIGVKNFELPGDQINPCATQNTNLIAKAMFSDLVNMTATLNLEFKEAANVKATLYKVVNNQKSIVQQYDFSTQIKDKVSLMLPTLELGAVYSVDVHLVIAASGTQVLNEVQFQVVKK